MGERCQALACGGARYLPFLIALLLNALLLHHDMSTKQWYDYSINLYDEIFIIVYIMIIHQNQTSKLDGVIGLPVNDSVLLVLNF